MNLYNQGRAWNTRRNGSNEIVGSKGLEWLGEAETMVIGLDMSHGE